MVHASGAAKSRRYENVQQIQGDSDSPQESCHAHAPAERLRQDRSPGIVARGAVHQADEDNQDRQMPEKVESRNGRRHHERATSWRALASLVLAAACNTYAGPAKAS